MTTGREKLADAVARAVSRHWASGGITLRGTIAAGVAGPGSGRDGGRLVLNPAAPLFVGWGPAAPAARTAILASLGALTLNGLLSGPGVGAFVSEAVAVAPLGPILTAELPNGADRGRLLAELVPWVTAQLMTYRGTGVTTGAGGYPGSGIVLTGVSAP